jgi:hypothetical protein
MINADTLFEITIQSDPESGLDWFEYIHETYIWCYGVIQLRGRLDIRAIVNWLAAGGPDSKVALLMDNNCSPFLVEFVVIEQAI